MPYAFSRTISDVLCTFKRFHNFIFHQSARWVYLGPGVKVGSLFWSARMVECYMWDVVMLGKGGMLYVGVLLCWGCNMLEEGKVSVVYIGRVLLSVCW